MAERITGKQWAETVIVEHGNQCYFSADQDDPSGWDVAPTLSDSSFDDHPGVEGIEALANKGFVAISGRRLVGGIESTAVFVDRLGPDGEKTQYTRDAENAFGSRHV